MKPIAPIKENQNAAVGFASGGGIGALVIWLASVGGYDVPGPIAAIIAGAISGVVLFMGREGIRGVAHAIWRGHRN